MTDVTGRGDEALHARIHLAALRRFAREGYKGARLADIATDAGLGSAAHLYYYAPRKLDLLVEVVVTYASLPEDLVSLSPDDEPRAALRTFLSRYLDAFLDERRVLAFQVLGQEAGRLGEIGVPELTANLVRTMVAVQVWFADHVEAGTMRSVDPVSAARAVLGFANLHVQLRASGAVPLGGDGEAVDALIEVLWGGVAPDT